MAPKILVVDDDDLNREVMEAFLSLKGYAVIAAGNGMNAIRQAETQHPDLIILDVRLPDIDGIEVCRRLKAQDTTVRIPVMIITGLSAQDVREKAESAGADLFFPRPFDGDDFMLQVDSILSHDH